MAMQLLETTDGPKIHVPLNLKKRSGRKRIVVLDTPETQALAAQTEPEITYHDAMVVAFARAFRWKKLLDEGKYTSIIQMADELGVAAPYMSRLIRLTLLAPDIIEAIVDGREPGGMSIEQLRKPMPLLWIDQQVECWGSVICRGGGG